MIIDVVLCIVLYLFYFYPKWKQNKRKDFLLYSILYIYICFVIYYTLMPIFVSLPNLISLSNLSFNTELFVDFFYQRGDYIRQIVLNLILMIPFGFLLPMIIQGSEVKKFLKVIGYTFLFSFMIEITQFLLHSNRIADVTDLVTNTVGGIIGFGCYYLLKPLIDKVNL